ncbi:hypothetical protein SKAU_G00267520 [Synaphobranchus kaupii]|uniref:Uncharacterized protein n=1 Tax=Synaphobranchus kaupii TaxID=118154 RepID=A0A9Q1IN78_SYNKA|nr:hypothetical protein SKAU_G00267520 [Synaphobranchus kaupii]
MIQLSYRDLAKQRQQQAGDWNREVQGVHLDLGRKISVPKDLMMEELQLKSNRGSLMFHERLKRVERFTVENANSPKSAGQAGQAGEPAQGATQPDGTQEGKENFHTGNFIGPAGKTSLLSSLKRTVAKNGSPDVLAPGYSGPLKGIPHERFNFTVIPKSYHCPWQEHLRDSKNILVTMNVRLPEAPYKITPANYKCFNRAPTPFGGANGNMRIPEFELTVADTEPNPAWDRLCKRPDFNRAPQGWGESAEL